MEKSAGLRAIQICEATVLDASEILALQKRAFLQEAERYGDNYNIAPITERLPQMLEAFANNLFLKAVKDSLIVGSIRGTVKNDTCLITRLIVEPIFQRRGFGRALLDAIEAKFPDVRRFELFTGKENPDNIRFYTKAGYAVIGEFMNREGIPMVTMEKMNKKESSAQ